MTVWQPRLLDPGEESALLQLLLKAYGTWPKADIAVDPIDHLHWKLEAGIDPYHAAVVEAEGEFVGAVVLSFRPIRVKHQMIMATSGGDVAVHPAYQGRGIFTAMTPFLLRVNMTADVSYGYRSRNTAVQKALEPFHRGIFGNFANVLVASARPAHAAASNQTPWELRRAATFDERIDALWQEAAPQFDFIAARTQAFLNWRFCDRRAGDFTCIVAEQAGRILGYAVERVSKGRGYLVDLLTLPDRLDVVSSLARRVLDDLSRAGVDEDDCWLPSRHIYFDALSAAGFATVKTTQDITYRHLRTPEADLAFLLAPEASVHFTLGDTDLV